MKPYLLRSCSLARRPALAPVLALVLALACGAASAQAIWKWRDRDGRLQVSDRPPPIDVPDKDILQRPSGQPVPAAAEADPATAASAPAGIDPVLEAKRKKLQAEQAAADKTREEADKARRAQQRAENCERARRQLLVLEGGRPVARLNDKGERELLAGDAREQEIARYRAIADSACKPTP